MTPTRSYPSGAISPHGAYYLLKGTHPEIKLRAYDDSVVFHLSGGQAIPRSEEPETAIIRDGGLKGWIPSWTTIDQKGATQDGVTFVDALYDPAELELIVEARGRDPHYTRQVVRDLIASIDAKKTSELSWFTHDLGRWWADVRWFKTAPDPLKGGQNRRQTLSLRLRNDIGMWRSYDHADQFRFTYDSDYDEFAYTTSSELGSGWTCAYTGTGGGYIKANGTQAEWIDDPAHPILPAGRTVVCRRNSFDTDTDNQVVEITMGSFWEWSYPDKGYVDVWGRMNTAGTSGTDGIRLRIALNVMTLSAFVGGVETVLRTHYFIIGPLPGEKWTLVCGTTDHPRRFKVMRNGIDMWDMTVDEYGTGSQVGAAYRGAGFGMHAGASLWTQATPARVYRWNAGDNATATQKGFLTRINAGDQPMFDRYTVYGPGTFEFADGPGSSDSVAFGPLLTGQVVQIRTDPRKRGVIDLTSQPPTPQQLNWFQQALADIVSFATDGNVPPLLRELESVFGIAPPQGNLFSLLNGRFSDNAAIPAKSPGNPAQEYKVAVTITDGNADSRIISSGTPLRRLPL